MDYVDLKELSQLLSTFSKENKNLTNFMKEGEEHNPQERELIRESLKANIQLAAQLQEEFNRLYSSDTSNGEIRKLEYDFQIECAALENLTDQILAKEKLYSKYSQCSEQAPLLVGAEKSCFKEEQKDLEGVLVQSSLLLQEASGSISHANRMCNELESVVATQQHFEQQEDWKQDASIQKKPQGERSAKAKYI